jgi:hypothetical protein
MLQHPGPSQSSSPHIDEFMRATVAAFSTTDPLRQKTNFLNPINLISPVQSSLQKYSPSRFPQITPITPAPHPLERGAYRDRHETLGWDAMDAAALGAQACSQGGFP